MRQENGNDLVWSCTLLESLFVQEEDTKHGRDSKLIILLD